MQKKKQKNDIFAKYFILFWFLTEHFYKRITKIN